MLLAKTTQVYIINNSNYLILRVEYKVTIELKSMLGPYTTLSQYQTHEKTILRHLFTYINIYEFR